MPVGVTEAVPGDNFNPTEGCISTDVAFDIVQLRSVAWPARTVVGLAMICTVGGGALWLGTVTATAADAVAVPPSPTAVAVNSVESVGVIEIEPDAGWTPMPGEILTDEASVDDQLRVVDCPARRFAGVALNRTVGTVACGTVGTVVFVGFPLAPPMVLIPSPVPPHPTAIINRRRTMTRSRLGFIERSHRPSISCIDTHRT